MGSSAGLRRCATALGESAGKMLNYKEFGLGYGAGGIGWKNTKRKRIWAEAELGESGWPSSFTLSFKKLSKNPSRQSLVRGKKYLRDPAMQTQIVCMCEQTRKHYANVSTYVCTTLLRTHIHKQSRWEEIQQN